MQNSRGAPTKKQVERILATGSDGALTQHLRQTLATQYLTVHQNAVAVEDDQVRFCMARFHDHIRSYAQAMSNRSDPQRTLTTAHLELTRREPVAGDITGLTERD